MDSSFSQDFDFSDYEIREQLELLGFKNINGKKFQKFKEDLKRLIQNEKSSDESAIFNSKLDEIQREQFEKRGINIKEFDSDEEDDDADSSRTYEDDSLQSESDVYTSRESNIRVKKIPKKKVLTRKVARKVSSGKTHVVDQVLTDDYNTSANNVSYLNENFDNLSVNDDEKNEENTYESDTTLNNDDELVDSDFNDKQDKVKSYIRPISVLSTKFEDPSRIRKNNPVSRYHEYSKIWSKQKAPGEKNHNSLRWSIREQMLEKHVIVKKPIRSSSNTNQYIVPTEKRRQDLRWNVRMAMANHTRYSSAK